VKPIIKVEHLGKRYSIGGHQSHTSLRDLLAATLRSPLNRMRNGKKVEETIWALKDVSFEVARGEVVGIIGRNGAGKSTLLKILSRITKPTSGRVTINGRIGSLLEVGTGFHSELTGRENIFLNGAVLGMRKHEIERRFAEIVAFAETEQFLDTPVKHYSSGMLVRLAFAVAAHLEPEIMIIDEVLAVGDITFQKKCLGKMNEVAKAGRTILFVSHDLNAVNGLCERAILLNEGSVIKSGPTVEVTAYYLNQANRLYSPITWVNSAPQKNDEITLLKAYISQKERATSVVDCRTDFTIKTFYENQRVVRGSRFFLILRNAKGEVVFTSSDYDQLSEAAVQRRVGAFCSTIEIPGGLLKAGTYFVTFGADVKNERVIFTEDDLLQFEVIEYADDTLAERHKRVGLVAPLLKWEISEGDNSELSMD
jgi:lipopolysaccharide transport system ATP-binding protein